MLRYREIAPDTRYWYGELLPRLPWLATTTVFIPTDVSVAKSMGWLKQLDGVTAWVLDQMASRDHTQFSVFAPYAKHTPAYKLGQWDGNVEAAEGRIWLNVGADFCFAEPEMAFSFKMRWC